MIWSIVVDEVGGTGAIEEIDEKLASLSNNAAAWGTGRAAARGLAAARANAEAMN